MVEETLYDIEIHRGEDVYIGRLFSDAEGTKEFKHEHLDQLLRDITIDLQLALDEFSQRQSDFSEMMGY
jgi:hypothetical protein